MYEVLDDHEEDEQEEQPPRPDTEFTLGPLLILGLLAVLAFFCGISFALGYHFGHSGKPTATATVAPSPALPATSDIQSKPTASSQPVRVAPPASPVAAAPEAAPSSDASPTVHPALPVDSSPAVTVVPKAQSGAGLMVEVAAVSHTEDADALAHALRKRGYTATERHSANDSLIHVQLGPFASSEEANQCRNKLLNDGYNAVVQP